MGLKGLTDILTQRYAQYRSKQSDLIGQAHVLTSDVQIELHSLSWLSAPPKPKKGEDGKPIETKRPFVSALRVYQEWKRPKRAFFEAHPPPEDGKSTQTFYVACCDKSWHKIPFKLKEEEHKKRAIKRADSVPIPSEWQIHANGFYDPADLIARGVSSPDLLPRESFKSIDMSRLCNDRKKMRDFLDWMFTHLCVDQDWPSYASIIWDGKRRQGTWDSGAYLIRKGHEPEFLGDNGCCEADVSVPHWIDYLHTRFPQDTSMRGAFMVQTTDGDTLAICMLRYCWKDSPLRIIWHQRADMCVDLSRLANAIAADAFKKHRLFRREAIEAFVFSLILLGSDFWDKCWLYYGVGNAKAFDIPMRFPHFYPVFPVEAEDLARLAHSDAKDIRDVQDTPGHRDQDVVANLYQALDTFLRQGIRESTRKKEQPTFNPQVHIRRLVRHWYYWREPGDAQFGSVFSVRKSEQRPETAAKKRKRLALEEEEDATTPESETPAEPAPEPAEPKKSKVQEAIETACALVLGEADALDPAPADIEGAPQAESALEIEGAAN